MLCHIFKTERAERNSMRRPISLAVVACLLFSAVLLAFVSAARASITYNIQNYPIYQTDAMTGGVDTISGTIVTDGQIGQLASSDITGGSYTITNPTLGSVTYLVVGNFTIEGVVKATATQILLPSAAPLYGINALLLNSVTYANQPYTIGQYLTNISWTRTNGLYVQSDSFSGGIVSATSTISTIPVANFSVNLSDPSPLGGNDPWVIAAVPNVDSVPEPSTLIVWSLLSTLAVGLGWWRKRKAA